MATRRCGIKVRASRMIQPRVIPYLVLAIAKWKTFLFRAVHGLRGFVLCEMP